MATHGAGTVAVSVTYNQCQGDRVLGQWQCHVISVKVTGPGAVAVSCNQCQGDRSWGSGSVM